MKTDPDIILYADGRCSPGGQHHAILAASRPFVLASLGALRLDPDTGAARQTARDTRERTQPLTTNLTRAALSAMTKAPRLTLSREVVTSS